MPILLIPPSPGAHTQPRAAEAAPFMMAGMFRNALAGVRCRPKRATVKSNPPLAIFAIPGGTGKIRESLELTLAENQLFLSGFWSDSDPRGSRNSAEQRRYGSISVCQAPKLGAPYARRSAPLLSGCFSGSGCGCGDSRGGQRRGCTASNPARGVDVVADEPYRRWEAGLPQC